MYSRMRAGSAELLLRPHLGRKLRALISAFRIFVPGRFLLRDRGGKDSVIRREQLLPERGDPGPPEGVHGSGREKGASVRFGRDRFCRKIRASHPGELAPDPLLRKRSAGSFRHRRTFRCHRRLPVCKGHTGLFAREKRDGAAHLQERFLLQIAGVQLFIEGAAGLSSRFVRALPVKGHHFRPVLPVKIAVGKALAVIEGGQNLLILPVHPVGALAPALLDCRRQIEVFAVNRGDAGRVLRLLHPALDLQRIHAGSKQFREKGQGVEIPEAQQLLRVLFLPALQPVGKTAGLSAASPVSAPSAEDTGEETLARIAVAQRAVNKGLDLETGPFAERMKLRQGKLPRGNDAGHAVMFQKGGKFRSGDRHLRARMERKLRKDPVETAQDAEVLDQHRVNARLVIGTDKAGEIAHLPFFEQCVDGQVDLCAAQMCVVDRLKELLLVRVVGVGPRAEAASPDVYRVRAGGDHALQHFHRTGRSQQFCAQSISSVKK